MEDREITQEAARAMLAERDTLADRVNALNIGLDQARKINKEMLMSLYSARSILDICNETYPGSICISAEINKINSAIALAEGRAP